MGLIDIDDTLDIKNTDENQIKVFSVKLDTSFTATVSGNKAIFDGFQAETFQSGNLILNDIDVKGGDGTLTNGTDLNVRLRSVSVGSLAGNVPDQLKDVEIKNINITTKRTFKKQP